VADDKSVDQVRDYHELTKRLMAVADKQALEETLRVLAVHVGYYQRRHGQVPMEETLAVLHSDNPTAEQLADLAEGLRCLTAVLMLATGVVDTESGSA